jgi:hypothetical protein
VAGVFSARERQSKRIENREGRRSEKGLETPIVVMDTIVPGLCKEPKESGFISAL